MLSRISYGSLESSDTSLSAVRTDVVVSSYRLNMLDGGFCSVSPASSSRSLVNGTLAFETVRDGLDLDCAMANTAPASAIRVDGTSFEDSIGAEIPDFRTRFVHCNNLIF
jgi:hypothetical protein